MLATHGYMGTASLEPCRYPLVRDKPYTLRGVDRHTYWIMPLDPVVLAGWSKIVGFGLIQVRLLSILASLVFLAAWMFTITRLTDSPATGIAAGILTAFDPVVLARASSGRMDMLCAALGETAMAVYILLFRSRPGLALVLANTLVAAAAFTHPVGGVLSFLGFWTLALSLNHRLPPLKWLAAAAIPYVLGAGLWVLYISQDPAAFQAQFSANASSRSQAILAPLASIWPEITRYLTVYGWGSHGSRVGMLKGLLLASYLGAFLACLLLPSVRKQKGVRLVLLLAVVYVVGLWLVDGLKLEFYMVYVAPWLATVTAVLLMACWRRAAWMRWYALALITMSVGGTVRLISQNPYARSYQPTIRYLQQHNSSKMLVMGNLGLGFDLGFGSVLMDDVSLGSCSGKQPQFIVADESYREGWEFMRTADAAMFQRVQTLVTQEFKPVFQSTGYTIYQRKQIVVAK